MSVATEESIYKLIPNIPPRRDKNARHKSKFHGMVKTEIRQNKAGYKTMGQAKVPMNAPQQFLKKHSKEPKLEATTTFQYPDADHRRPRVPANKDCPQPGAKSNHNFITSNAVNNIKTAPKNPCPKYVDKSTGSTFRLEESGLVPKYVKKKEYGKTPRYLERHKAEMREAQVAYDNYVENSLKQGQMEQVEENKRVELLDGLKKNWDELNHKYQGLSVVTDTVSKKAHKEQIEAEMKQLERDIELVERHKVIYIASAQV